MWLGSSLRPTGQECTGARRGVRRFSPRLYNPLEEFSHDRDKLLMSKMKSDAPTDVNLRDDFATGQATSSQSVQTPSTIQRDELLSQYTRDQDSLELSDTPSSDGKIDSESHAKEPRTTIDTAIYGVGIG